MIWEDVKLGYLLERNTVRIDPKFRSYTVNWHIGKYVVLLTSKSKSVISLVFTTLFVVAITCLIKEESVKVY